MALAAGSQLGPYEVIEPIGAGGMGEVYRARDTKLGRDVAIKVLPEEFARDKERLDRFQREAKLLAQLNHTNVATLYGFEESDGQRFLAMELVEGETLADRIARGPIPIDEAILLFIQIAEGLEAAHEKAIIHRDLKPANVKLTPDDDIKILDFGLAKAFAEEMTEPDSSMSPTLTRGATRAGIILGTAAYMSPEQAKGKSVDKRADIWSFGVVLYEALTGKRLFTGETVSDVLAAVLTREVDFGALPGTTPPHVRHLLQRCLERDPKRRLRDIGEAKLTLQEPAETAQAEVTSVKRPATLVWLLLVLLVASGIAAIWGWLRPEVAQSRQVARLRLDLPEGLRLLGNSPGLSISDDGSLIAFPAVNEGERHLYIYRMDNGELETMPNLRDAENPALSPDGTWLAYTHEGRLKKVAVEGGEAVVLRELTFQSNANVSWAADDTIIFSPSYRQGLWRMSAGGGEATMLTEPDASRGELGHWFSQVLPGGRHVLFTNYSSPIENARIEVLSLESGERKIVLEGSLFGRYVPSGHLIYMSRDALMATRFDFELMKVEGLPIPVSGDVYANTDGYTSLAYADNGTLVYAPVTAMSPDRHLVWVDRDGNVERVDDNRRRYANPRLSPDGQRIAVAVEEGITSDVWVLELTSGTLSRISFGVTADFNPHWSPDGSRLFYTSEKNGNYTIYSRASNASDEEQPILVTRFDTLVTSISPTGDALTFTGEYEQPEGTAPLGTWVLPIDGDSPAELSAVDAENAAFSPDGRLLTFDSPESGRDEVYIQSVAGTSGKRPVSVDRGAHPTWSHDGRELYFRNGRNMMAVSVDTSGGIRTGRPRVLFQGDFEYAQRLRNYDVAPDGRFLMVQVPESAERGRLVVVINWFEELERLVPTED